MRASTFAGEAQRKHLAEEHFVAHNIGSRLLEWSVLLVRWANETQKPEAARLEHFRGNRQNFGNQFVYSDAQARAIAVHADAILEWLRVIAGANELVRELYNMQP